MSQTVRFQETAAPDVATALGYDVEAALDDPDRP